MQAETHAAANARLIDFQAGIELVQAWGGGLVASVDGMRFVVPVATINAGPNPHYFGMRRGATWLNAVNDQYPDIGAIVVPGTVRDSLYILDLLLHLDGGSRPDMVVTDEASYTDVARLSPLRYQHLNMLGRYPFTAPPPGELRPLCDPSAVDDDPDVEE